MLGRGQEFAVMKLVLAVAFAAALLVIVTLYAGSIQPSPSAAEDIQGLLSQAMSARGQCFHRTVTYLPSERYPSSAFTPSTVEFKISARYSQIFTGGNALEVKDYRVTVETSASCDTAGQCTVCVGEPDCSCP